MDTIENIEKLKQVYINAIAQLDKRIEELNQPLIVLAEKIHSKRCKGNHTDSWLCENWAAPQYAMKFYLHQAKMMLQIVDIETANKLLDIE